MTEGLTASGEVDRRAVNRAYVAPEAAPQKPMKPLPTPREAYERYLTGKGFGRSDLFGVLVTALEQFEARLGGVDEAAVNDVRHRVESLETVIGNALRPSMPVADMTPKFARMNEGDIQQEKRGPGRPKKEASNG